MRRVPAGQLSVDDSAKYTETAALAGIPAVCRSRGALLLDLIGGDSHEGIAIWPRQIIRNKTDGFFYLFYGAQGSGGYTMRYATAKHPAGPYTRQGAVPGWPTTAENYGCVVSDGGNWYAFVPDATTGAIDLYRSTTGIAGTYSLLTASIVSPTAGKFDSLRCVEPWAFRLADGSGWGLIYMGQTSNPGNEQLGLAQTTTITGTWTKQNSGNPVIANGASGSYDSTVASDSFVVYYNGLYHVWYNAAGDQVSAGDTPYNVYALATTPDLATFTKRGPQIYPVARSVTAHACTRGHRGSFYRHSDGLVYFARGGGDTRGGDASPSMRIYMDVIDPVSFLVEPRTSPWLTVEAESSDARLTKSGSWSAALSGVFWSGSAAVISSTAGDSVEFLFEGTAVRWITGLHDDYGIADVYLNGSLTATVDTYNSDSSATARARANGYEIVGLPRGYHSLKIVVSGSRNGSSAGDSIVVDAFEYVP